MDTIIEKIKKPLPPLNPHYTLARFEKNYYKQVIKLFTKVFCDDEPMTRYINMQYQEFYPFAEIVTQKALEDQLSALIIEKETNQVVALALVEDFANPASINIPLSPKFDPILTLLEQLAGDYFHNQVIQKNEIAHLFITAVDENHRHKGLSTNVNFYAMHIAKEKKFKLMISELTNTLNEKGIIPHLNGFKKCLGEIIYKHFTHNHQKPFSMLNGLARSYLWQIP